MKKPTPRNACTALFGLFSLSSPLFSQLQVYESFDYPLTGLVHADGTSLGDGSQNGGLGFSAAWAQVANNNEMEVGEPGLTFTDSLGNALEVAGYRILRPSREGIAQASRTVDTTILSNLTGDDTTMWMSFLFVDEGFSGPDASVVLASTNLAAENNHTLAEAGDGVGIFIGENTTTQADKMVEGGYFLGSASSTRSQDVVVNPNDNEGSVYLLAAKVNWKPDGTLDELYVFNIEDLSSEPAEEDAIAVATFDMSLPSQQSLNTLCVGETQIDSFDEIRLGTSFADVVPFTSAPGIELSIAPLGGELWEVELVGIAGGAYSFYSAPDLQFEPGTLIEGLTPGTTGSVAGPNNEVLVADETGVGVVQMTLTGDSQDFIRAVATEVPPVLALETFEGEGGLPEGWTATDNGNGTAWMIGTPNGEFFEPIDAFDGVLCVGTNMNGIYSSSASASLVSPSFTVPAGGASLELSYYIDTELAEEGDDFGSIRLLNTADDSPLAGGDIAPNLQAVVGDGAWILGEFPLPAVANGLEVKIEFAFVSDGDEENFAGFYVDTVTVVPE